MSCVLDASMAACWAFDDEDHPAARRTLDQVAATGASVPALWWYELRNILVVNERRGRIDEATTSRFLTAIAMLPIDIDHAPDSAVVMALARRLRLSAYDAAYIELAQRRGETLATLDRAMAAAARGVGVAVIGPE